MICAKKMRKADYVQSIITTHEKVKIGGVFRGKKECNKSN